MRAATGVSEEIYQQLKQELINMELVPGQHISENEISTRFHASRTPTRDVFTRLEMDGLIEVTPHVGTFVSPIHLDIVNDVLYLREKIEVAVLEELAAAIDPMQKFKLSVQLIEQGNLLSLELDEQTMAEQFHLSDNQFHRNLFQIVRKERVFDHIMNSFYDYERYRVFLNMTQKQDLQELYHQHLELSDNLSANNIANMKLLVHEHLYGGLRKAAPRFEKHPEYFVGELKVNP